ncbi:Isochorismatase hydrolase [Hypoxylon cercidicola]|nr:Isochorismatase hydrolase [Hypoxylon cercidicola]
MALTQQFGEGALTFSKSYAVLNLDWMTILIDVHRKSPQPPVIFTTLFFNPGELELANDAPFSKLVRGFGPFAAGSAEVQIAPQFTVDERDVILLKTRWYAGAGNDLEQILKAQAIDTVILSGLTLSDYLPPGQNQHSDAMLNMLVSKMNLKAISIGETLQMLEQS